MDCTCSNNVFIRNIVIATHQSQYLASMHLHPPLQCLLTHSEGLCSCSLLCHKPLDESSRHSATNKWQNLELNRAMIHSCQAERNKWTWTDIGRKLIRAPLCVKGTCYWVVQSKSSLRPIYTGDFCHSNLQFLSQQNCIKFQTCSKPPWYRSNKSHWKSHLVYTCDFEVAALAQQKLHWVATTKITWVNRPLSIIPCTLPVPRQCLYWDLDTCVNWNLYNNSPCTSLIVPSDPYLTSLVLYLLHSSYSNSETSTKNA